MYHEPRGIFYHTRQIAYGALLTIHYFQPSRNRLGVRNPKEPSERTHCIKTRLNGYNRKTENEESLLLEDVPDIKNRDFSDSRSNHVAVSAQSAKSLRKNLASCAKFIGTSTIGDTVYLVGCRAKLPETRRTPETQGKHGCSQDIIYGSERNEKGVRLVKKTRIQWQGSRTNPEAEIPIFQKQPRPDYWLSNTPLCMAGVAKSIQRMPRTAYPLLARSAPDLEFHEEAIEAIEYVD
ncbi:conserved hypothetical protein [Histoplasma capsulatum G186AR]|uniref:Uncharacterized protein n=1 Tax=Ajellomyces capsulatus (strain G186AR / H82 / ATCC MYA-2454 / RMSCC 2432) TaxID=447093 RepID=C0NVF5_AJECG|nr:uncharacterized protein HCBG_07135 [Histoplasma capsulatum G186AR]EEH04494.1 conserved hypothetical protein [Histoplasma capsulatum G186AR]